MIIARRSCARATSLLAGRSVGLTDAQRLELEAHLAGCDACARDERDLRALLGGAGFDQLPTMGARTRERVIASAIRAAGQDRDRLRASPRSWRWAALPVAGLAMAAAAVALLVTGDEANESAPVAVVAPDASHAMAQVVVDGVVTANGVELAPGATIEPGVELTAEDTATIAVGHAHVKLSAATALVWRADESAIELRRGRVHAVVDPAPQRPFHVRTRRFEVQVLGTVFAVSPRSVRVEEGAVRVIELRTGNVLVERLEAGGSWKLERRRPRAKRPEPARPASDWLTDARRKLAAGDVEGARDDVHEALDVAKSKRVRAEAHTLLADCELVDGDPEQAAEMYGQVADRYRDLPAGENALFAAGRAWARAGRPADAERAFRTYLERYPRGKFRKEAEGRLSAD